MAKHRFNVSVPPKTLKESLRARATRYVAATKDQWPIAAGAAEGAEKLAELVEAYHSMRYVVAVADGGLSYESVTAGGAAGLAAKHEAEHMENSAYPSEHPWECSMQPIATFPTFCVYEMMGKMYQVSYVMEGTQVTVGADDVEVTAEFSPVPGGTMAESRDLWEPWAPSVGMLTEASVDRDAGVLRGVVLINRHSVNGVGSGGRDYSDTALRSMARMSEGRPAYLNHTRDKADAFKPRDVRDLAGEHRNVRFEEDKHRVVSDLHIAQPHREWLLDMAETMPNLIGLSPVSRGLVRAEGDREIVDDITAVRSGDLVTDPAATRGLFEHREIWQQQHSEGREGLMIKLDDIQKALQEDKSLAAAVREMVAGAELKELGEAREGRKTADAGLAAEKGEHEKTRKALTESQAKIEGFEAADALRVKQAKLDEAIGASDLGQKYGKIEGAVTAKFKQVLLQEKQEDWADLIADRVKILSAAVGKGGSPTSSGKDTSLSEGQMPADIHARMAAALV